MRNLIFAVLTSLALSGLAIAEDKVPRTYQKTRKLLSDVDVTHPNKAFRSLFQIGDARIADLIHALKDKDSEIRRRAQIIIRYLSNPEGIKALHEIYANQNESISSGPVPIPLADWDYKFLRSLFFENPQEHWGLLEFNYIFALLLDDSPRADAFLKELEKARGLSEARMFWGTDDVNNARKKLSGEADLPKLVLSHAFFVRPSDRQYTSARLVALNGAKDKAFVEIYIDGGVLAEKWWHVVISKQDDGWRFNSIYQAAVS